MTHEIIPGDIDYSLNQVLELYYRHVDIMLRLVLYWSSNSWTVTGSQVHNRGFLDKKVQQMKENQGNYEETTGCQKIN